MDAGRGGAGGALGPHFSVSDLSYSTPAGSQSPGEGHSHSRVHTYLGIASHIVHINAQEVAEPVRHEHGSQVGLDHGVNAAAQEADARQLLQVDAVGQAVHVRPPDPCGSKGGYDELWSLAAWPRLPEGTHEAPGQAEVGGLEVGGAGAVPGPALRQGFPCSNWGSQDFPLSPSHLQG